MPEEQIRHRTVSPVAVLTAGLMRMRINYSIVHVGRRRRMDRQLQYHARMISREKQAKAVKRMMLFQDGREIGARRRHAPSIGRSFWDASVPRRCAVAGCAIEAGLFQYISDI
ncbi:MULTISPECIES: hypothetical protein [Bradyrhizobium]|uniref:hypothetical protein n=2 Tax=Nitrobacteraceae TaxID=41294 RepID=UPI0012FC2A8A|nr:MULTISPECIES: hypothetical protein [unclassified Bradyrhizobium]MDA9422989.1 hypothetical protein [Bradyrhizobium sp. CCBAU 53380]